MLIHLKYLMNPGLIIEVIAAILEICRWSWERRKDSDWSKIGVYKCLILFSKELSLHLINYMYAYWSIAVLRYFCDSRTTYPFHKYSPLKTQCRLFDFLQRRLRVHNKYSNFMRNVKKNILFLNTIDYSWICSE